MADYNNGAFCEFCVRIKNKFKYFGDATILHGFRNVFSLSNVPFLKRTFWLIMIAGCGLGAADVLREVLKLYSEDAFSYSVDTSYLTWDTPFPAVTVCQQQLNPQRLMGYIEKNKLPTEAALFLKDVSFWNQKYCKSCEKCLNTSRNKTSDHCFEDFLPAVQDIRSKCSDLLSECWWDGKKFSCCDHRYKTVTPELMARGTRARIALAQLPALRVRRLAIRDTLGLVVDIGSVGKVCSLEPHY